MTRSSRQAPRSNHPANMAGSLASKAAASAQTERFRCPFTQRFPKKGAISKTCSHGSLDIRHVKEHIKNHHGCTPACLGATNSPSAKTWCDNVLHTTPDQLRSLNAMKRRSKGERSTAQWLRMFSELFPNAPAAPTAPCLPTSDHLKATADGMTEDLAGVLGAALDRAGLSGGRPPVEAARLFASQFGVYVDIVSLGGLRPAPGPQGRFGNGPRGEDVVSLDLATLASATSTAATATQASGESLDSGGDVDTSVTSGEVELGDVSIEAVPHDTVIKWIGEHAW